MATQPDIQAILAALAAQNRTPAQQPAAISQIPQGYPAGIPQQVPTPSYAAYGLPQPTSSGSLDLSSVRPISTGSVSIAEAIAKAKSIAEAKNIPSAAPRDDPRLTGRVYGHSRSRSRSPPRRDVRDNYNPYRDERRGEERRGGSGNHGRDRSASPRRGGAAFPPRDEKESETITVKSALVGLIIGRAGENLRRVETETGARVQFVPAREPGAQQRQCTISGTRRQLEAAKREIYQTIEDNGGGGAPTPDPRAAARPQQGGGRSNAVPVPGVGETTRQILVPDKTVGLIIGRGGETIRDLQDRSGCHVNIVSENKSINGKRPVNLIGTKEAADKAEAIIWEIVDSDTRAQQQQQQDQGRPQNLFAQPAPARVEDDKSNESVMVPSEAVGMIIGKGGESIKEMQNRTGCKINVNQPGNPDFERKIDLVGSWSSIESAKKLIWEKVDTVQQRDRESGRGGGNDDHTGGYAQQQQQQPAYGQGAGHGYPAAAAPALAAAAAPGGDAADPYAQYGGYQNYMALWFAAMQQQQGGQPPSGQ